MIEKDPWLYPGCPCEVWDKGSNEKEIAYFLNSENNDNRNRFITKYPFRSEFLWLTYDYYRPIGTPWDYVPKEVPEISIGKEGYCYFWYEYYLRTERFLWPSCPDHLKEKTWPRPEWAKE